MWFIYLYYFSKTPRIDFLDQNKSLGERIPFYNSPPKKDTDQPDKSDKSEKLGKYGKMFFPDVNIFFLIKIFINLFRFLIFPQDPLNIQLIRLLLPAQR